MAAKPQPKTIYRTAKGAQIDLIKLINQNEMTVAGGNARVNARGDKLGPNGQIIQKREEIIAANTNQSIPDQLNVRQADVPPAAAKTPTKKTKDVSDMDPEGNE